MNGRRASVVFALYSRNIKATQTSKFLTFPNFLVRMPLLTKKRLYVYHLLEWVCFGLVKSPMHQRVEENNSRKSPTVLHVCETWPELPSDKKYLWGLWMGGGTMTTVNTLSIHLSNYIYRYIYSTVCPRNFDLFCIVRYYIIWVRQQAPQLPGTSYVIKYMYSN